MIIFLFANCSSSELDQYKKIVSAPSQKAVFQIIDLTTEEIRFDTIETSWKNNVSVVKHLNDSNSGEKMLITFISRFDFDNNTIQRSFLNYDLLGDSIRYIDTTYHKIKTIKKYNIEGRDFEVIKETRSAFSKSGKPTDSYYISKEFGWIGSYSKSSKALLIGYKNRPLKKNKKHLIDLLKKDVEFFHLE